MRSEPALLCRNVNRLRALEGELARTHPLDRLHRSRPRAPCHPERQVSPRPTKPPRPPSCSRRVRVSATASLRQFRTSWRPPSPASPPTMSRSSTKGRVARRPQRATLKTTLRCPGGQGIRASKSCLRRFSASKALSHRLSSRPPTVCKSPPRWTSNRVTETSEILRSDSRSSRSSQTVEQNSSEQAREHSGGQCRTALRGNAQPVETGTGARIRRARATRNHNYEISRVQRRSCRRRKRSRHVGRGRGRRDYTTDAGGTRAYARATRRIANITTLVDRPRLNETRGDQVQVTNMRFAETEVDSGRRRHVRALLGIESAIWFKDRPGLDSVGQRRCVFLLVVKPDPALATPIGASAGGGPSTAIPARRTRRYHAAAARSRTSRSDRGTAFARGKCPDARA